MNTISPEATALAQRDCILDVALNAGWGVPKGEAATLAWVRNFYKDLFADTGGVPVPSEQTDGCMINHPDIDLANPEWKKSGIPCEYPVPQGKLFTVAGCEKQMRPVEHILSCIVHPVGRLTTEAKAFLQLSFPLVTAQALKLIE